MPKPIDLWLAIGGVVVAIILYLVPKTPYVVVGLLAVCFLLVIHPVWNFWWIADYNGRRIIAFMLVAGILAVIGRAAWPTPVTFGPDLHGVLIPANDPTPPFPEGCTTPPPNAVILILGPAFGYTTEGMPVLRTETDTLLSLSRGPGGVYVSARVYSEANRVIAQIHDNEFHINPSQVFHRETPDWSTLVIKDNNGVEVLRVSFINRFTIKVLGTFFTPEMGAVRVTDDEILFTLSQNRFGSMCVGESSGMFTLRPHGLTVP
ncbi:MAG TPA: hypothetical protein VGJ69_03105 [Pyrinomonadaceae bacterium]|jgi:hypothetical protein